MQACAAPGFDPRLHSAANPFEFPPVAFRRPAFRRFKMRHRFTLFRPLDPQLAARLRLLIQRLRHRRRPAHLDERQHVHFEFAALVLNRQPVAHMNFARRLGRLSIRRNPAQLTRPGSQRARLKEPRGPKPLVDSHALKLFAGLKSGTLHQLDLRPCGSGHVSEVDGGTVRQRQRPRFRQHRHAFRAQPVDGLGQRPL